MSYARSQREDGVEEGIEKGKAEGKAEIAKSMLNLGLDLDIIIKSTGLSEAEIKTL